MAQFSIHSFAGDVTVNSAVKARIGMTIKPGDRISVGERAFCLIKINEKNVIRLGADSEFSYDDKKESIELKKGWMSGVFRKKFTRQGELLIKTPTVTASIRGTAVCTKVESDKSSYFCVCNGIVRLEGDETETVKSSHHMGRRYVLGSNGNIKVERNPGLLYHTDKDLEKIAELIDEKMDWTVTEK